MRYVTFSTSFLLFNMFSNFMCVIAYISNSFHFMMNNIQLLALPYFFLKIVLIMYVCVCVCLGYVHVLAGAYRI